MNPHHPSSQALFPLDTIKTRLQAKGGFLKSGGFQGVYAGLSSAVAGSAPSAALFFVTYEAFKHFLSNHVSSHHYQHQKLNGDRGMVHMSGSTAAGVHMLAASAGEVTSCIVRVPTEVLKQRLQTKQYTSLFHGITSVLQTDGIRGFYRGFGMTVFREIPFTCIQFPLYEFFKNQWSLHKKRQTKPWEAALFGSVAGSIAAALTTPLDVLKTRIMLSSKNSTAGSDYGGIVNTFQKITAEEGYKALFSGIVPRVFWIGIGGFIFLGTYELAKTTLSNTSNKS